MGVLSVINHNTGKEDSDETTFRFMEKYIVEMKEDIILRGLGTALVTPFKDGKVDWDAYEALVTRQAASAVDFLVPLGTTAETPCLTGDEKWKLLKMTKDLSKGKPVLAGVGTNSLEATAENMSFLHSAGPDAWLVVVPYYNKPTQEGLFRYFSALAARTPLPIVLYNVPGRTGTNMLPETTLRLAEIPNIVGVKEASGNIAQIEEIIRNAPSGFIVLSGNDDQTFELMEAGAHGVISVASNIAPDLVADMAHALREARFDEAEKLNDRLMPLFKGCFAESNPIPVKAGLSLMGLCSGEMRLPLTSATPGTIAVMKEIIEAL